MANFTEQTVLAVWGKAHKAGPENEARGFRKDDYDTWIKLSDYGNRNSKYGWEIDHVIPESKGGSDLIANLRPLHWHNNASRGNGRLAV